MARITHRAASARPAKTRAHRNRPYKVIQETVTQNRKKLLNAVTFSRQPPHGFLFVPTGNPTLNQRCKDLSRLEGSKIFTVHSSLGKRKNSISREVNRAGHHFAQHIVVKACAELGIDVHEIQESSFRETGPLQRILEGASSEDHSGKVAGVDVSQEVLNARARDAIKDLFPLIPDRDLQEIISGAFRKGNNKVGTVNHLSLARRVQLAVVAHIRHVYTEYDNLLRTGPWLEARRKVEEACLYRLVRWRGDDDAEGNDDLEQIVREVVVISDDDSDADDDDIINYENADRDSSLEIISGEEFAVQDPSRVEPRARSLAVNHGLTHSLGENRDHRSPEMQPHTPSKVNRRGFTRYRAWDQALERFRSDPRPPRLAVDPPMRCSEDQISSAPHRTILTKRSRIPSPAAESSHHFARPSDRAVIPTSDSHEPWHIRETRDPNLPITPYLSPPMYQNYYPEDNHHYDPLKVVEDIHNSGSGFLSGTPQNASGQRIRPGQDMLIHGDDNRRFSGYEDVLPSVESSTLHNSPIYMKNDRVSQVLGNDTLIKDNKVPRSPDDSPRGYPMVQILDHGQNEHDVAFERHRPEYLPILARKAHPEHGTTTNGIYERVLHSATPPPNHGTSSLHSPLHSGVSRLRLASPSRVKRVRRIGPPVELSYSSDEHGAAYQRSRIAHAPVARRPQPLLITRESSRPRTSARFPTSNSSMNMVHSSLPTSSLPRSLDSIRDDYHQWETSAQDRGHFMHSSLLSKGESSPNISDDYRASHDARPFQQTTSRDVSAMPVVLNSNHKENRPYNKGQHLALTDRRPLNDVGSCRDPDHGDRIISGRPVFIESRPQNALTSNVVYDSRSGGVAVSGFDNRQPVHNKPTLVTQADGRRLEFSQQARDRISSNQVVDEPIYSRRIRPPGDQLRYRYNTLEDHDVIVLEERKENRATEQYHPNEPRYMTSLPRHVYEERLTDGPQYVPANFHDNQRAQNRAHPPKEIIVLE